MGKFTITVRGFIFPFTKPVRKSRHTISENMKDLNKAICQLDLNNSYKPLLPTAEHPHCPNVLYIKCVKFHHTLSHKTRFKKFKRIKNTAYFENTIELN